MYQKHQVRTERGPSCELFRKATGALTCSVRDPLRYEEFRLGDGIGGDGKRVLSSAALTDPESLETAAADLRPYIGTYRHARTP